MQKSFTQIFDGKLKFLIAVFCGFEYFAKKYFVDTNSLKNKKYSNTISPNWSLYWPFMSMSHYKCSVYAN